MSMKFSICIPVHNSEVYLREAIISALSQSRAADEILIVDDASTDRSADIANSREWGGRIRYVYNDKSTGWLDAFNRIIDLAEGDFVTILGCDDILSENFLFYVENALKTWPSVRFCYTGHYYIDAMGSVQGCSPKPHILEPILYSGKEYAGRYLRGVFSGNHINRFSGVAIDRNLLKSECSLRKEAGLIADDDFLVRVGAVTDVVGMSQPLVSVRNHSLSVAGRLDSLSLCLAENYMFQVRCPNSHNHLEQNEIHIYKVLAAKFIYLLLLDGLRASNRDWISKAVFLHRDFKQEVPDFASDSLTIKEKFLWAIVKDGRGMNMRLYHKFFPLIRKIKRVVCR